LDLNPHQIDAALFALQSPLSGGALLADEVGLGKTIEAGIVLCQLWAHQERIRGLADWRSARLRLIASTGLLNKSEMK
jgi:SNF2 family DNA or RNA helicase